MSTAPGWAEMYDRYQSFALQTRLRIPLLYGADAVHGHNNVVGAVVFPHNIGLGATRDPDLIQRIGAATAAELSGVLPFLCAWRKMLPSTQASVPSRSRMTRASCRPSRTARRHDASGSGSSVCRG